jgi:hypothetical protein
MKHCWLRLVVLAWALALGACASSFERDWKVATQGKNAGRKGAPLSGAWDGKWTSEKHRMPSGEAAGGRLRCIFAQQDERHYRAKFCANWLTFATSYEATFDTQRKGGVLAFQGERDLGAIFGGVYRYDGRVTPAHFGASFVSRYDHGRFEMSRWAPHACEVPPPARAH